MVSGGCMKEAKQSLSASTVLAIIALVMILLGIGWTVYSNYQHNFATDESTEVSKVEKALPKPELSEGIRGEQFGIDKNINETTLDQYLGRKDVVYRDMRMLKDPGNYEAIGGDSYLSGFVEGFEIVPLPYIINVSGLPEAVGETYNGKTLFTQDADGKIAANYLESIEILEDLFPKDKTIFLMCGGGGYAGMTKDLLVKLGWDANKIYNVGAYWSYDGEHNIEVKTTRNGKTVYDFWKVPYHDIDFAILTEKK